jgi:hypothetical protein
MKAPKLTTAKLTCSACNAVSYIDIRHVYGDDCSYAMCVHCNQIYHTYNDMREDSIAITLLLADEAINVLKLEEKYRDHKRPFVIRKTKTVEQFVDGLR